MSMERDLTARIDALARRFADEFGCRPEIAVRAPGRAESRSNAVGTPLVAAAVDAA